MTERVPSPFTKAPYWGKISTAWFDAKRRCYDAGTKFYQDYGGRGIVLAPEWVDDCSAFYLHVSGLPGLCKGASLDRVDNDGGYTPGNLRWATPGQQVRNRRGNRNNSSGTTGVTWYYNDTGGTRAIAWWNIPGGPTKSKSFPVKKFGLLPAYKMAVERRKAALVELNTAGADYTSTHGQFRDRTPTCVSSIT